MKIDEELKKFLVKGVLIENDNVMICGFFSAEINPKNTKEYIPYIKDLKDNLFYEVNPYGLCKNTEIKDKTGSDIFEYDLLEIWDNNRFDGYGYIIYDKDYNNYIVRTATDGMLHIDRRRYVIVGNLCLKKDIKKFEKYKKEELEKGFIDNSRCARKKSQF